MRIILFTISILFFSIADAQGFLRTSGKRIVDKNGEEVVLKGIGLGGWMLQEPYMLQLSGAATNQSDIKNKITGLVGEKNKNTFYSAWLANHCTKKDIDSLAVWGFNSVRLPMHYNLFTLSIEDEPVTGNQTWLEEGFRLTDSLLSWCKANGLYLILDLHAAPGGQGKDAPIADYNASKPSLWENEENKKKTIALWKKLAERYKQEEWMGGYDLINETNWGFSDTTDKNGCAEKQNIPLRKLLVDITAAIREVDTNHIIFIEGNCWGNNYEGVFPLWDKNIVVSFHKYWNYNNLSSIQKFLDIRNDFNVPVWMGESGENSNLWFRNAIALFEENKIGWAWWPLKKLGINNPLQIKSNEGYNRIIKYWRKEGEKPSADDAYKGLMQLAHDAKIENNLVKRDVLDAMFRQVNSTATLPFFDNKINDDAILFAVDYDLGRNGWAYYDLDTANFRVSTNQNIIWNKGRVYRNDGVDIVDCFDKITNGFCVTSMEKSEWLQYTVDVVKAGVYDVTIRFSAAGAGMLQLQVDGQNKKYIKTGSPVPEWKTETIKNIKFTKGTHIIKILAEEGNWNLNYIMFNYNQYD